MKRWTRAAAFLLLSCAASGAHSEAIPFEPERWALTGEAEFVTHGGRMALRLGNGRALLRGTRLETGTIEFDMAVTGERGFAGLMFRMLDEDNYENFYIRPHQSGNPDANQYQPVVNGVASWQIFSGEGFGAPTRYRPGEWMRVRMDVYSDSAMVSIEGARALHITDLKREPASGGIGFGASFAGAVFSNVSVVAIPGYTDPQPIPPPPPMEPGAVREWMVSEGLAEEDALRRANARDWTGIVWTRITAETNGIANLARGARREPPRNASIARFLIRAGEAAEVPMRFGFSDRVTIFLNGRRLYRGDATYASRDYRFLGTVGFWDSQILQVEPGDNEVTFVVVEDFGGWAAAARIEPDAQSDVSLLPGR